MQTILLIDDDEALRSLIVAALQDAGYDVIEAANGATGADLARHHLPDLIISDVVMQGADGYDLLKVLRQDPATAGIPLILVTGYGSKDGMRRGMQEGADDYLTKPF
jgi:CheY-like chemotaxis protein